MPRKTSNLWSPPSSMEFGSEEELAKPTRIYVDPWDLENYAFMRRHLEEEPPSLYSRSLQRTIPATVSDSPTLFAGVDELDFHNENFEMPAFHRSHPYDDFDQERKLAPRPPTLTDTGSSLSSNNENFIYSTDPTTSDANPFVYIYETTRRKRKITLPKKYSRRSSSYIGPGPAIGKFRRIRNIDCTECSLLESAGFFDGFDPDYQMRMEMRRPPPENFGLSSYGHLKIDYSCSWHSLDRLIQSSEN